MIENHKPYIFEEFETGFSVQHPVKPIKVSIILNHDRKKIIINNIEFSLLDFRGLLKQTVCEFLNDFKHPEYDAKGRNGCFASRQIKKWLHNKIGKVLNHRFLQCWKNLLIKADQTSLIIEKRLFNIFGPSDKTKYDFSCFTNFKNKKIKSYFISDLLKYRAAAYLLCRFFDYENYQNRNCWKSEGKWMQYIAGKEEICSNLKKTLMFMPGNISIALLKNFKNLQFPLQRFINNRIELISFLIGLGHHNFCLHRKVLEFAKEKEIRKAFVIINKLNHNNLKFKKTNDIGNGISWILDYPNEHNCKSIVKLAELSKKWHREQPLKQLGINYKEDSKTAIPPIELPKIDNIKFLENIRAILDEGTLMNHCIPSYAAKAIRGDCYLFHVNYKGEHASAEIDSEGKVVQIRGPSNKENGACKYGKKILNKWGENLRNKALGINKSLIMSTSSNDIPF